MSASILRPNFGRKGTGGESSETDAKESEDPFANIGPLEGEALYMARRDVIFILTKKDYVQGIRDKIDETTRHITSLIGGSTSESIELRRQGLASLSFEDLCAQVEEGHPLQWSARPAYYIALAEEYQYRVTRALSLMPE